jgi:hypothetical protein
LTARTALRPHQRHQPRRANVLMYLTVDCFMTVFTPRAPSV